MKKILLGTTALVAATVVSAGVAKAEISMNMWAYQGFGVAIEADDATSEDAGAVSYQNSNINFVGSNTLENGMTVGMTIDMYSYAGATAIDEMRFSLTDDWGTLDLGGNDTVMDIMSHAGHWVTANGVASGTYSAYAANYTDSLAYGATQKSLVGDAAGIRYFSPVMNGVRVGVSYMPDGDNNWSSNNQTDNSYSNIVSGALEYNGDMDGVSLGLSAGIERATLQSEGDGGDDDAIYWSVGGEIGTGGFSLGLGYAAADFKTSSTTQVDAWTFAATGSYSTGAHTIGLEYMMSEKTPTIGGSDTEQTGYLIGYNYAVGSGVYMDARIAVLDTDGPTAGNSDDADATIFETGIGVSF